MSERIVESLNEMKQIYLESVSGNVISNRDEYLEFVEEKYKKSKKEDDKKENKKEKEKEEDDEEKEDDEDMEDKPKRWWDDDGDGKGWEKGEVGGSFKKKVKKVDESFSNWRDELYEVVGNIDDEIENSKQKPIKERSDINNKVDINPNINIGESVELSENYIEEVINFAAQYFYGQGLNEDGLQMVIEDLGVDKFIEYVFYISEDLILTEARTLVGKKKTPATGKNRGISLKASPGKITKSAVEKYGTTRRFSSYSPDGTVRKKVVKSKGDEALEKAVKTQELITRRHRKHGKVVPGARPSTPKSQEKTTPTQASQSGRDARINGIKKSIGSALRDTGNVVARAGLSALKGHEEAMNQKKVGSTLGQQLSRGLKTAATSFVKKGTAHLREDFVGWIYDVLNEEIDISDWSISELYEQYLTITEKAESEQQQKLFGLALSVKRGKTPRAEVSKQVLDIVDSMSETQIRKYAKTSHKGLPKKVED